MPFQLYNTLTRQTEALKPSRTRDGRPHLRMYACGPTVYSFAHIGNFRSFLTADLVARVARALDWELTYVMNVTDVGHLTGDDLADAGGEDKMARALEREGSRFANIWDLARFYTEAFLEDWDALNLRAPSVRPRASEHVREQIEAVAALVEAGHAYETSQGVYFDVSSYEGYGKLSGNEAAEALVGGAAGQQRSVVEDEEKRDPRDFALWKKAVGEHASHLMQWHSPWDWGFPGWHIECTVMAERYLGHDFDLHTGGEDLIFPHHECEIAQGECLPGAGDEPFARHWLHTRFLQVEGEKMSKSMGNFFTVRDLIAEDAPKRPEGLAGAVDPLALRLALLSGQYRKPYNFTLDTLKASAQHVQRLRDLDDKVAAALDADVPGDDHLGDRLDALYDRALEALLDDLNTPAAVAAVLDGAKLLSGLGENLNGASARSTLRWLDGVNDLLGIVRPETQRAQEAEAASEEDDAFAQQVEALIAERTAARENKDYARADALRDEIDALGVEVMDSAEGTTWRKKPAL